MGSLAARRRFVIRIVNEFGDIAVGQNVVRTMYNRQRVVESIFEGF
jgi:hypothetical protein